jgi:hypothetical protein
MMAASSFASKPVQWGAYAVVGVTKLPIYKGKIPQQQGSRYPDGLIRSILRTVSGTLLSLVLVHCHRNRDASEGGNYSACRS